MVSIMTATIVVNLAAGLYLIASVAYYYNNQYGMALAFLCYAIANIGLALAGRGI